MSQEALQGRQVPFKPLPLHWDLERVRSFTRPLRGMCQFPTALQLS